MIIVRKYQKFDISTKQALISDKSLENQQQNSSFRDRAVTRDDTFQKPYRPSKDKFLVLPCDLSGQSNFNITQVSMAAISPFGPINNSNGLYNYSDSRIARFPHCTFIGFFVSFYTMMSWNSYHLNLMTANKIQ